MSFDSQPLVPVPGERGLASYDVERLAALVLGAWDAFLGIAAAVDLDAPSRCPGWTARQLLAHLGSWPGDPLLGGALDEARTGLATDLETGTTDQDGRNARVVAAHGQADREAIMGALRAAREHTLDLLGDEEARSLATAPTPTLLGPLPLFGFVAALPYDLAVHALDLVPAGAPAHLPPALGRAGIAALVDLTAAMAARARVEATFAAVTPGGTWAAGVRGSGWTTVDIGLHRVEWPAVEGRARVLLDVSAGRAAAPPLLLTRELRVHKVAGLLALAPLLESVPGLPGGAALRTAARYVGEVGKLVRRIPGVR